MIPLCKACSMTAHPHWQRGIDFYSHCCAKCCKTNAKEHNDYCLFHAQCNEEAKVNDGVRRAALPRGETRRLDEKIKLYPSKLGQAKIVVRDEQKKLLLCKEAITSALKESRIRFQTRQVVQENTCRSQKAERITNCLTSVKCVYSLSLYGRALRCFEGIYLLGDCYSILRQGRECFKEILVHAYYRIKASCEFFS